MKRMTTPATPESNYFAYGANLHIAQMKSLCPRSAPVCPARLQEYRLTIALPATAPGNQPGWATVTPHKGAEAPGALFRLHSDETCPRWIISRTTRRSMIAKRWSS